MTLPTENRTTKADAPAPIIRATDQKNQPHHGNTSLSDAVNAAFGVDTPIPAPGQLIRFGKNKKYWLRMFSSGDGAQFGDHTSGEKHTWFPNTNNDCSREDIAQAKHRAAIARAQREIETKERYARTAQEVADIRARAPAAPENHGYLVRKQIEQYAHLFSLDKQGRLIAFLEFNGRVVGLQYIAANGEKRFYYGAQVTGTYCVINKPEGYKQIIICEGIATGCTLTTMEPSSLVVAAMNAGNLLPVARNITALHPQHKVIIAGDNDRFTDGNPGKTKAIEVARAIAGEYAIPEFPPGIKGTDYNDLACAGCL